MSSGVCLQSEGSARRQSPQADDVYKDTVVGISQGGNISPLLANVMLNELAKELEARRLDFVRYADDLIIMVGSKQAAERVMKSIT